MLKFFLKLLGLGGVKYNTQVNNKQRIDPTMGVGPLPDEAGRLKVIGDNLWRKDPGGTWVIIAAWPHKVSQYEDLPAIAPNGAMFDIGDDRWIFLDARWVKLGSLDHNGQFISRVRQGHPLYGNHLSRHPTRRTPYPVPPSRQREDDNIMNAVSAVSILSYNSDSGPRNSAPIHHSPSHSGHDHGSYDSSPSDPGGSSPSD